MAKATNAAVEVADRPAPGPIDESAPAEPTAGGAEPTAGGAGAEPSAQGAGAEADRARTWWPRRGQLSARRLALAGLVVLLLSLWCAGGWLVARNHAASELAEQRVAALSAAQKVATDLTSITGDNAQSQIRALTQESTGSFREQISTYGSALEAVLRQARAGSTGTVSAAAIDRIDATSATALVAVSAKVSNSVLPTAQPVSYRMDIQLQRQGDRWLVSEVRFLP
jgi:Mce-associated membrane protein